MRLILSIISLFLFSNSSGQTLKYIEQYRPIAEKFSEEYSIPSSIILAVAIVETGGGNSKGAKIYNNHFGIVGKNTVVKSRYKSFETAEESFEAFCQLVSRKKYFDSVKDSKNEDDWINAIASGGYARNAKVWKKRLRQTIKKYNLKNTAPEENAPEVP